MKWRNNILFFMSLVLMTIPMLIQFTDYSSKALNGAFEKVDSIPFSKNNWFDKNWQENQEEILKNNLKIRPTLIRTQHEMDHRLFREYHMNDMVVGKEGFLFSRNWASARCCTNHLNYDSLSIFVAKLKKLSDLAKNRGKYMKVIIPPSKEEIYSHLLPYRFSAENHQSDYKNYIKLLDEAGIEYWDLLDEYKTIIDTSLFPVYSKTSVHWTNYGAHFTTIRLLDDMEKHYGKSMNKLGIEKIRLAPFEGSDGDFEKTLNLFSRIDHSNFAYPKYVTKKADDPFLPKVLTFADSYYWAMNACWRFPEIYSTKSKFLYYYSKAYPNNDQSFTPVKDLNIEKEFLDSDAYIFINSSHNLEGFPFGFEKDIDRVIKALQEFSIGEEDPND